jgi:hypothetical protein
MGLAVPTAAGQLVDETQVVEPTAGLGALQGLLKMMSGLPHISLEPRQFPFQQIQPMLEISWPVCSDSAEELQALLQRRGVSRSSAVHEGQSGILVKNRHVPGGGWTSLFQAGAGLLGRPKVIAHYPHQKPHDALGTARSGRTSGLQSRQLLKTLPIQTGRIGALSQETGYGALKGDMHVEGIKLFIVAHEKGHFAGLLAQRSEWP